MSTFGSTLSSHRGRYQAALPSSVITAGVSVIRTTNASTSTPIASAKPIEAMIVSGARMNPANTDAMMMPAAVTTRDPAVNPLTTARFASAPCT